MASQHLPRTYAYRALKLLTIVLLLLLIHCVAHAGATTGPGGSGGGSGGTTVNNFFTITNNTVGAVLALNGGFTNAQVGQATAPSMFNATGVNPVNTFVPAGVYTNFNVRTVAVAGTNLTFYILTNGVPTGVSATTSGAGGGNASLGGFTVGAAGQSSITIGISNNAGTSLSIPAVTWSLQMLVPTSVQSVTATVVDPNSITNGMGATWATNALAVAGSHVYVGYSTNLNTYGFSTRSGWFTSTSKGQALQDAFNYYTTNLLTYTNNGGQIFTTNYVGLTFELGPADYNNPFYRPQGYYISNICASSSWHIYGQGFPNTLIVGDSNVLFNSVNGQAGATPFEEIDHLGLCFSNYYQKSTAVNLSGVGYLQFHDNWITPMVAVNPTNYYFSWAGGDSAGTYVPLNYTSGIVDLVISGNTGRQSIYDNIFGPGAAGVVCLAEHIRFYNNEFKYIGSDSHGHYTSHWLTNDATVLFIPDGFSSGILGGDIALGSGVIMGGLGDFSMIGDKWIGCNTGTYFKGVTPSYGRAKLTDCHFEALITGPSADVVLANDSDAATVPSVVDAYNCYDQQTFAVGGGDIDGYSYDTATFKLALNSNMGGAGVGIGSCYLTSLSTLLSPEDLGGTSIPMFSYVINGIKIFTYDAGNSNATINDTLILSNRLLSSSSGFDIASNSWSLFIATNNLPFGATRIISSNNSSLVSIYNAGGGTYKSNYLSTPAGGILP